MWWYEQAELVDGHLQVGVYLFLVGHFSASFYNL